MQSATLLPRRQRDTDHHRATHNILEKNRRAQLRDSFKVLRQHVPLAEKPTNLSLLQSARKYIESLQQKEREEIEIKVQLEREHSLLVSRLVELGAANFVNSTVVEPSQDSPEIDSPGGGILLDLYEVGLSPSPKNSEFQEDNLVEDDVMIDVLSEESESSTANSMPPSLLEASEPW